MKRLKSFKPTPSMVVASLALLVALSGTGIAAVAIVTPSPNSVGTLQLKNNAVTSTKVLNGSLLKTDFKAGQILNGAPGIAGPQGAQGAKGDTGAAGAAGVAAAGYVAQVLSVSSTNTSETTADLADLSGASITATTPNGETDNFVVFFSGQSNCVGGTQAQNCLVRILLDGNELAPAGGTHSIFDTNRTRSNQTVTVTGGAGAVCGATPCTGTVKFFKETDSEQSNAIIRVSGNVTAGSHVIKAQFGTSNNSANFALRNWTMVVQRVKAA